MAKGFNATNSALYQKMSDTDFLQQLFGAIARLEAKVDDLAASIHEMGVLRERQENHREALSKIDSQVKEIDARVSELERARAKLHGMVATMIALWVIIGAGVTWLGGKIIAIAIEQG